VVVPAAFSGIMAAYILGISRAVGETMILAVAAGMQPNLTWNPMEPAATITAFIVQVALGDLPHGSVGYQTIFAAGLTLMLMTLVFNMLGYWLRTKYREATDGMQTARRDPRDSSRAHKRWDVIFGVSASLCLLRSACSPSPRCSSTC
jgi:ABC-type branched-subunit amino acid transport system permease subunit